MKRIILSKKNWKEVLKESVRLLHKGGVIIYPTETSYGIGADAMNKKALQKVFRIKGREKGKSLSVLMASQAMTKRYAHISPIVRALWAMFLPGPLTLIIPRRSGGKIGVRFSAHPFAESLVRAFGKPITATSANLSGTTPLRDAMDIVETFQRRRYQPSMIIDAGKLPKRAASTVVDCTGESVRLLRKGPVTWRAIRVALRKS